MHMHMHMHMHMQTCTNMQTCTVVLPTRTQFRGREKVVREEITRSLAHKRSRLV